MYAFTRRVAEFGDKNYLGACTQGVFSLKVRKAQSAKAYKGVFYVFSYIKFNLSIIRVPLYIGDLGIAILVNAAFLFYDYLQNLRHLDATYAADNQRIIKSYENAVAFLCSLFFDDFCDINPLEQYENA